MEAYCDYFASARADRSEPVQVDEHVQAVFARELAEAVHQPLHDHAENLDKLRNADFGPKTSVKEGAVVRIGGCNLVVVRSEEHTSELQSLMRISYAVFCLKKKNI